MTEFNIKMYDVGGKNAIPNDGQLTGSEVKKAKKDGWNIWEGYSANDPQPTNAKQQKAEAEKEYLNLEEFDKGGKNAIAGDGKLTGDEVIRANRAGYPYISEGDTAEELNKYPSIALRDTENVTGSISRYAANKTTNKFVQGLGIAADLILFAPEFYTDMFRAITGKRE